MPTQNEILYGDEGYTGEVVDSGSVTQYADIDYYRNKIREFQSYLNALATTGDQMSALLPQVSDADLSSSISTWLSDLQSNTGALRLAAQTVNAAAEGANAFGVRMPVLSIPQQLAALPLAAVAAIAGAVAGTAWAVSYAIAKMQDAQVILSNNQTIANAPPEQQAAIAASLSKIQSAQAGASGGWLGSLSNIVMWGAIAVAAWFGFKAFRELRG